MRHLVFSAAVAIAFASIAGCDACGNSVVEEIAAPDGKLKAVLFNRDCGASTGFSSQLSILPAGQNPSDSGNAFVADSDHGAAEVGAWGGPLVAMRWTSAEALTVTYAPHSRTFKTETKVQGVTITYLAGVTP